MKKTIITFDQAGGMKVDATGFVGKACEDTTAKLMQGIGATKTEETKKPEGMRRETTGTRAEQRW